MKSLNVPSLITCCILILFTACMNKSPEKLPKFKKKFRTQIASFEKQKTKTNEEVNDGVIDLTNLRAVIDSAKNVDKEFNKVYGAWEKVNKDVKDLNREYESLKADAENLFNAMEAQTAGLRNETTKKQLNDALAKTRSDYQSTLDNTAEAIDKLKELHAEALDIVSALEVAVGIAQFEQFNEGLKSIETRVASIMDDLNKTIVESKELYDTKIGSV